MGIKEVLSRPDGLFISLHKAISKVANDNLVSYAEAAQVLHTTLRDADPNDMPGWVSLHPDIGLIRVVDAQNYVMAQLRISAKHGEPEKWPLDEIRHQMHPNIGFSEDKLASFLAKYDIQLIGGKISTTAAVLHGEPTDMDPADQPEELHMANLAFRAVTNGYGDQNATQRNRLIEYIKTTYPHLKTETLERIATVANPDKAPGRKKRGAKDARY